MRTVEAKVQIDTENGQTTYTLLVPVDDAGSPDEKIHKVLGSSLVLGASLLDAEWGADGPYRVRPGSEDETP